MTITELLAFGAMPPAYASPFLHRIRGFVPVGAFLREGKCPIGSFLVPFVDRRGAVAGWCVFAPELLCISPQFGRKSVSVRLECYSDPTRIYRVDEGGNLEVVFSPVNEDW
jgi:hypothetical protein